MIDIFVTFYSQNWFAHIVLPLLRDCLNSIEQFSEIPHQAYIVDNGSDKEVQEELETWQWPLIKVKEPFKNYSTVMNAAIRAAKTDPFVCLHGDMKVTENWLKTLVEEHAYCGEYFETPCCLTPHFLHYEAPENHILWREGGTNLMTSEEMHNLCIRYQIPYRVGTGVISRPPYKGIIERSGTAITDDGSHLMSFIGNHAFFEKAGMYDVDFTGREDNEMGMRALMKGLKILQTHNVFIHHAPSASIGRGPLLSSGRNPYKVFLEKYSKTEWDKLENGELWIELHEKQYKAEKEKKTDLVMKI